MKNEKQRPNVFHRRWGFYSNNFFFFTFCGVLSVSFIALFSRTTAGRNTQKNKKDEKKGKRQRGIFQFELAV